MKNRLIEYAYGSDLKLNEKMEVGEVVVWFSRVLDDLVLLHVDYRIDGIPPMSFIWK